MHMSHHMRIKNTTQKGIIFYYSLSLLNMLWLNLIANLKYVNPYLIRSIIKPKHYWEKL